MANQQMMGRLAEKATPEMMKGMNQAEQQQQPEMAN